MTTHISEKIETKGLAEASAAEVLSAPSSPLDDLSTPDSPDGGTEAWLFVLAGFLVLCNSWAIADSYGAFQAYYQFGLLSNYSTSAIAWIGALESTLMTVLGVVSGPLTDKGYVRPVMIIGHILLVLGLMTTSVIHTYWQALLAQGICTGLGAGLIQLPALSLVCTKFAKNKRPIAIGLVSSGGAVGGVIFPIIFRRLQPHIGFGWTVRVIGFISVAMAIVSCTIFCRKPGKAAPRARAMIDPHVFVEPAFVLFAISIVLQACAYYVPIVYVTTFAIAKLHMSEDLAFYLLGILNAASLFGRLQPLWLSLFGVYIPPAYSLLFWEAAATIIAFSWIAVDSTAGFVVWVVIWGFQSGILVTAPAAMTAHPAMSPSLDNTGGRIGIVWLSAGIGSLIGGPLGGLVANVQEAIFWKTAVFAGSVMAGGALLQAAVVMLMKRHENQVLAGR